ncbi:ABC transporter ATP-binding protein [Corynebacterium pseudopelargi]|uniref:Putative siderophore transport system ATP-binding protein YusV n=1 Tax=Corynebacterium pseudopelargi TaxID=2080757 RepID=A0A3G6IW70_9CORY|nr:ABC transporter ATP-binding protein [Corynebacterium pseudopelargi]AZA09897.1 putative siderophore transport system ATP-binding protein YusV [Corynebacterium pseudopelargi]
MFPNNPHNTATLQADKPSTQPSQPENTAAPHGAGTAGVGGASKSSRMIQAEGLSVRYSKKGDPIIDGIDLCIGEGVTALIGPNGCGKSTLLRTMARLMRPTHGSVVVDGKRLSRMSPKAVARMIAVLGQHGSNTNGLSVRDIVGKGRYPYQGLFQPHSNEDVRAVDDAIEQCGIGALAHQPMEALSGGQQQRAWIAMTLAQTTPIVFFDEPTSYLDIGGEQRVLDLVGAIAKRGIRVVVVLHDVDAALKIADTIVVMRDGAIVASGPSREVLSREIHQDVFGLDCKFIQHPKRKVLVPHLGSGAQTTSQNRSRQERKDAPISAVPACDLASDPTPAIRATGLATGYQGTTISSNLDVRIAKGAITGVIGPNGCGKSTLVRTLTGIMAPLAGSVAVHADGGDMALDALTPKQRGRLISVLSQKPEPLEGFSVEDVIVAGRHPHGKGLHRWRTRDQEAVEEAMKLCDVHALRHRPISQLSGGQRQRVWLARALAQDTDVLVLDEPTTYLDRAHQVALMEAVAQRNAEAGTTVLMVLHDINLAARYCHHMLAMCDGEIVAAGKPQEVLTPERIGQLFEASVDVMDVDGSPVVVSV